MRLRPVRHLSFLLVVAALLAPASCSNDSDVLTIYSGRQLDLIGPILERFAEEEGVDIEVRDGTTAELALLIEEEGDRSPADVFLSQSPGAVAYLDGLGRLTELPADVIAAVPPADHAPDGRWVGLTGRVRTLVYNPDMIAEADLPDSVLELTDPRFAGQIAVSPPNASFQDFVTGLRGELGDDATLEFLEGLAANDALTFGNNVAILDAVNRGEIAMGLINHYYWFENAVDDPDQPAQLHFFEEGDLGSMLLITAASVLDTADDPELAQRLVEFLLGEEAQTYFAEETLEYPLAAGVEPVEGLFPLEEIVSARLDFDTLGSLDETIALIEESGLEGLTGSRLMAITVGASRRPQPDEDRASRGLTLTSVAVAVLFVGPLAYLVVRAAGVDDAGDTLGDPDTWVRLRSTLTLAVAVSAAAAVVGTALAWVTTRTDLPFRRVCAVAAALPLVYPSFVAAAALVAAVAPGGLVDELVPGVQRDALPTIDGFSGAFVVLTLFTYPYVYLPVAARVMSLPPSFEESALLLGRSRVQVFRTVVLPQIASSIWAGALLVFLYTVSDYGAVAQMRYQTLSVEIVESQVFDADRRLVLGLLLGLVAVVVVIAERAAARRRGQVEVVRSKAALQVPLGRWRWPAFGLVFLLLANALLGPLSVLAYWTARGFADGGRLDGADLAHLAEPAGSTALLSLGAALAASALVLPVADPTSRHRSRLGGALNAAVVGGFALPGFIVALSLVFWTLSGPSWTGGLYQTVPILLVAYVVHFGAQAMRSSQVAVAGVSRRLDDAARSLGAPRARRFTSVEFPLMLPGLLAGAGLVLLSTMKELPATLLLRPTSVQTLAVEIWRAREAARWSETGLASLVLVALSAVLTWFFVVRRSDAL